MELALDEQLNSRNLSADKKEARSKMGQTQTVDTGENEAMALIKKYKKAMRIFNIISAVSIVGLPVALGNMLRQAFVGNLLGVKSMALESEELGVLAILFFLILACLVIIFTLIAFAINPWSVALTTLESGIDWIMGN